MDSSLGLILKYALRGGISLEYALNLLKLVHIWKVFKQTELCHIALAVGGSIPEFPDN